MTDLRTAAQMALEALEALQGGCTDSNDGTVEGITVWCPEVIEALNAALSAPAAPDMQAKEMFVARLEAMGRDGHTWLTVNAVLALLNDCDMLASGVAAPQPQEPT